MQRFTANGLPASKTGIGIPFYGYQWTGGGITAPRQTWSSTPNLSQINYNVPTGPQAERDSALSMPTGVAWAPDGGRVYVTALGSDKLAVLSGAGALLARVPTVAGPTGVIVDGARQRLYLLGQDDQPTGTFTFSDVMARELRPA